MNPDVIIIGAGFAGASTAYHLARRGHGLKILLLDRETGYGMHASGRNAAMLRQATADPDLTRMIAQTRQAILDQKALASEVALFRQTGSCLLGTSTSISALEAVMRDLNLEVKSFSKAEPLHFLPEPYQQALSQARYERLLYTPGDGVVDVHALLTAFVKGAQAAGVQWMPASAVQALEAKHGGWRVICPQATYETKVVVNASGAWANQIGRFADLQLAGLRPLRRHLCLAQAQQDWPSEGPLLWNIDEEFYFRPESGGLLLSPGDEVEQSPGDESEICTDPEALVLLAQKLKAAFPVLADLKIRQYWACLRTKVEGQSLFLDWESAQAGFLWVSGLGGHGMSSSDALGRLAAQKIVDYLELRA